MEDEIEHLQKLAEETGGKALKFRLGGRMSNNVDSREGRSEALIGQVRKVFGSDFALYADSNSSYDVQNAIRIGRLMEEHDYAFFEEPCPFDHLWETKRVADALSIPIAGGEQEFSMRRFRWAIANRVVDVAQPDLHYFGGYMRTIRVARMANAMIAFMKTSGPSWSFTELWQTIRRFAWNFCTCLPNSYQQDFSKNKTSPAMTRFT